MPRSDPLIDVAALSRHLHEPAWRVVDCRFELTQPEKGYADYLAGHIPGAVYAHLDRDLAGPVSPATGRHPLPEPAAFAATLGKWGITPQTRVVVYDQASGAIAARLWWMLRWLGHERVALLDGGFEAWRRAGLALQHDPPDVEPATYEAGADERMVATTAEIAEAVSAGRPLQLVDARGRERYSGRTEPIDSVAGHVPGARNLPFETSLRPDGRWRAPDELARAWSGTLDRGRPWIAMCGSGVTACHLALSAELAGLPPPRLYAGSFSEWIRDPARPVAREDEPGNREPPG